MSAANLEAMCFLTQGAFIGGHATWRQGAAVGKTRLDGTRLGRVRRISYWPVWRRDNCHEASMRGIRGLALYRLRRVGTKPGQDNTQWRHQRRGRRSKDVSWEREARL